jgi:hypothetical protein
MSVGRKSVLVDASCRLRPVVIDHSVRERECPIGRSRYVDGIPSTRMGNVQAGGVRRAALESQLPGNDLTAARGKARCACNRRREGGHRGVT